MKERPILFSAPMVRALLDGRKTQTRRVVKPQPESAVGGRIVPFNGTGEMLARELRCPYGVPGDRLWVRETFTADFKWPTDDGFEVRRWEQMPAAFRSEKAATSLYYFADRVECHPRLGSDLEVAPREQQPRDDEWETLRRRPSIYMPRWASRLTLELTDVRVERLQDISEEDATAEGACRAAGGCCVRCNGSGWTFNEPSGCSACDRTRHTHIASFRDSWNSINAKRGYGWDANCWVWCLSFRVLAGAA